LNTIRNGIMNKASSQKYGTAMRTARFKLLIQ
jgi:hypothetical protein